MIDFSKIDRVIHEKVRLSVMTLLASRAEAWPFQDLKSQLELSDGNLITHLRVLEKAGLIDSHKGSGGRRPQTSFSLTAEGRTAFLEYLEVLERILKLRK